MMAGLSRQLQENIANWVRGSAMPAAPASLRVALSSTPINDDGTGITEPILVNGYQRLTVTLTAPVHTEGAGTMVSNANALVFGPAVNVPWPTITHAAVFDNAGNMLFKGPVATPRTAIVGDTLSYGIGTIQFRVR